MKDIHLSALGETVGAFAGEREGIAGDDACSGVAREQRPVHRHHEGRVLRGERFRGKPSGGIVSPHALELTGVAQLAIDETGASPNLTFVKADIDRRMEFTRAQSERVRQHVDTLRSERE